MRLHLLLFLGVCLCSVTWGQTAPSASNSQPQSKDDSGTMPHHDMSNMKDMPMSSGDAESDTHIMHSMEGHMDMGPHMKMTALRPMRSGDASRAQQIAADARTAAEKYTDYRVALSDGFRIFHPELPQKIYHFTSFANAIEAQFKFNPAHPTSLLYEKQGSDYKLVGVMYTAPKTYTEEQLDERIPLSIAQWHEHVDFCIAPAGRKSEYFGPNAKFGLLGSIHTQQACDAEGGKFRPVVFNWMVHVYPFEKDQASIWSVERQHGDAD